MQFYEMRFPFNNKDFVKINFQLRLSPSFRHISNLEDYWVDHVDEYEARRISWMRMRQIVTFKLNWDISGVDDDELI